MYIKVINLSKKTQHVSIIWPLYNICNVCRDVSKNLGGMCNDHVNTTVLSCVTPYSLVDI